MLRNQERLISFVGSGGKTGLMMGIARCLVAGGRKVIVTTTTKVLEDEVGKDLALHDLGGGVVDWKAVQALLGKGTVFVHDGRTDDGRLKGVSLAQVKDLGRIADTVLVEADGGKRYPIKRPREGEPVIPGGPLPGLVCVVVGLDAVGRRMDQDTVFNWKAVVDDGIAGEGDIIDGAVARGILFRKRGYMDVVPRAQSVIVMVNKVDGEEDLARAVPLARDLYHTRTDSVVVTSARTGLFQEVTNRKDRVFAVILAAGASKRFGGLKQVKEVGDGRPMVAAVVENAISCGEFERVVVVVGHRHDEVEASLGILKAHPRVDIVVNDDHMKGMSTSMNAGLAMAEAGGADAIALMLSDMPGVGQETLDRVMDAYRSSCCRLCHPKMGKRWGHPVVIRKELFDRVRMVAGDKGARDVVMENAEWAQKVVLGPGSEGGQIDIDTPKEYEAFLGKGGKGW